MPRKRPVFAPSPLPSFATVEDAWEYLYAEVDDPCVDNTRFAWADDAEGVAKYDTQRDEGCCGRYDCKVAIGGREAYIGCNFGH